jgi:phosphatidate cytidylyltransferase
MTSEQPAQRAAVQAAAVPPPSRLGRDLPARLATAAAGIPLILVVILAGGPLYVAVVALLLGVATGEISRAAGLRIREPLTLAAIAASAALGTLGDEHHEARIALLTAFAGVSLIAVVARAETDDGFRRWTAVTGAVLYVGLLGSYLVGVRQAADGRAWLLLMLFTTFASDSGAFFVGRAIGGRKLAPRVSPGKTLSGAVGGLVTAAIVCALLGMLLDLDPGVAVLAGLGVLVSMAAQAGDLAESLLKRSLGVKDMSRLFPGHGGLLDRLDSVLFAAPVIYWMMRWINA